MVYEPIPTTFTYSIPGLGPAVYCSCLATLTGWVNDNDNVYKYQNGAWQNKNYLIQENEHLMSCAEGVFIRLSNENDLDWSWDSVKPKIVKYI